MKMIVLIGTILLGGLLSSCGTQSVYLQNITVTGPQVQPPLFITNESKPGDVRISPRLQLNDKTELVGRASGHSNVNTQGFYQVDTVVSGGNAKYIERNNVNTKTFQGRNFAWTPMRFNASIDLDYVASKSVSLVGGISYASGPSQSFLAANLGVGFFFEGKNLSARVDIGAHWSSVKYDVEYVITSSPFSFGSRETEVAFFHENGKDSHWNSYGALTINTNAATLPVQFFTQLAINRQTVVDLQRRAEFTNDKSEVLESVSYFLITPGLYFNVSPTTRILAGVQLRDETALLEADPGVLVAPFVQFEFGM